VEQFRPGTWMAGRNPWQLEPPAGMMEESESIEDVGRRETREEARCEVSELEPVYDFLVSAGCSTEIVYTFCGRTNTNALETFGGNTEEDEDTRIHVIEFADAMRDLAAGRFEYSLTIICLQWLSMHRERLREMWR